MYLCAMLAELLAPYNLATRHTGHIYAPPQAVRLFHAGRFVGPFVYGLTYKLDRNTLQRTYTVDRSKNTPHPVPVPGRALPVLGPDRDGCPPLLSREGRHAVPAGNGPDGAGHVFPPGDRFADIADHRLCRRRDQFPARHRHRRTGGLLRRLDRFGRSAHHRGAALLPGAAAVDGVIPPRCRSPGRPCGSISASP